MTTMPQEQVMVNVQSVFVAMIPESSICRSNLTIER